MRKVIVLFFVVVSIALAGPLNVIPLAIPAGSDLMLFPPWEGPITVADMAKMHLSPKIMEKDEVMHNYDRKLNRFLLDTIKKGELVLIDDITGRPKYKVSCSNRLVDLPKCPICPSYSTNTNAENSRDDEVSKKPLTGNSNGGSTSGSGPNDPSPFWDNASKTWSSGWGAVGSLFGFLLPLLALIFLLFLIAAVLHGLWTAFQNNQRAQSGQGQNPPPPAPNQPPAPAEPLKQTVAQTDPPATVVQPPAPPPEFPENRVIMDFGDQKGGSTRIKRGKNISRIEYDPGPNGSSSVRIFHA